jgi:hypothetical protein
MTTKAKVKTQKFKVKAKTEIQKETAKVKMQKVKVKAKAKIQKEKVRTRI